MCNYLTININFTPSGVYMEFVAQLVECQVVALVVVGSIPIKLPKASIAQW